MDSKKDIYDSWVHYTTQNEEVYFRHFISGFVLIWEKELNINWEDDDDYRTLDSLDHKANDGPSLSRLPEELLPAIGKFLYVTKDVSEKDDLSIPKLQEAHLLVRSLVIISRNLENISSLATTCDYARLCISVASVLLMKVGKISSEVDKEIGLYCMSTCQLLESIYDPFLTWRYFKRENKLVTNHADIHYSSSAVKLHVEVVPFIYECFDSKLVQLLPKLGSELVNVLGAIVSGSQLNALQGVCPATTSLLVTIISDARFASHIRIVAIKCFILMIYSLLSSQSYQRQIEIGTLIELFRDGMISRSGTEKEAAENDRMLSLSTMVNMLHTLVTMSGEKSKCIQSIMVQSYILEMLLDIIENPQAEASDQLVTDCIRCIASITRSANFAKERMVKVNAYCRISRRLKLMENHSHELLIILVELMTEETYTETKTYQLKNSKMLCPLLELMPSLMFQNQEWLSVIIFSTCTCNLQCRWKALKGGVLKTLCTCLAKYDMLSPNAITQLINLLENLGSISICTSDLKQIYRLFCVTENKLVPHYQKLLHAILNIARVSGLVYCRSYFDIQSVRDGLTVSDIKKWPGPLYGLTFHCWISLNRTDSTDNGFSKDHGVSSFRRQILTLATPSKHGLEIFISAENSIVVGVNTKKEFLTVTECDHFLDEDRWYCIDVTYTPSKRPFGQNTLSIFVDGVQKVVTGAKFSPMIESFTWCCIGAPIDDASFEGNGSNPTQSYADSSDRSIIPTFISQVPNYITFPLRSYSSVNPNLKNFPSGMQDTLFGPSAPLYGQLGTVCLFQEPLTIQHVKELYDAGPNCNALFSADETSELGLVYSKLVFSYSPCACAFDHAVDLAGKYKLEGRITAPVCDVSPLKEIINSIGGIHSLFLLLETEQYQNDESLELAMTSTIADPERDNADTIFSNYTEAQLEENPLATITILLNNLIKGNIGQELFQKKHGFAILGELLTKVSLRLLNMLVLNSVHLLVETSRNLRNPLLIRSLYQHVLFNFEIWSRGSFPVRLGHVQFVAATIKTERKYFRKRFGVQFLLDVIKRHLSTSDQLLNFDEMKSIRSVILEIVKHYLQKDTNVEEVSAVVKYIAQCDDETLISEMLDLLIDLLGSRRCQDQIFLLLYEPHMADVLYTLLVSDIFSMDTKQKLLKLFSVLLRTDKVYERSKCRLRLQDSSKVGMYPGLISLLPESQTLSMEVTLMLLDQILLSDSYGSIAGAMSLLHHLSTADIDIKLEAARKILTVLFMKPTAPAVFAKEAAWQDCVTRLLIKHSLDTRQTNSLPDLMSLDIADDSTFSAGFSNSDTSGYGTVLSDIGMGVLEGDLKEVAGTVSTMVVDNIHHAADNLTSVAESVSLAVTENIHNATANITNIAGSVSSAVTDNINYATENITSVVNTAYSFIKYQTGSSEQEHLKQDLGNKKNEEIVLDSVMDTFGLRNRSRSSSSAEDLIYSIDAMSASSDVSESSRLGRSRDELSVTSAQSAESEGYNDEDQVIFDMLQEWKNLEDGKTEDKEYELCYTVVNILFTIMWRGFDVNSKASWKEKGQVITCINMLGSNNSLYRSHLEIKLKLFELMTQAALTDLTDTTRNPENVQTRGENAAQLLRWIYDMIVLDPNPDDIKKTSVQLLDGIIGLFDALLIFKENPDDEWTEMVRIAFGILLKCARSSDPELRAMSAAKLHTLIQIRAIIDIEECSYLLFLVNEIMRGDLIDHGIEQYSFLMPVVKTLVTKLSGTLNIQEYVPELLCNQSGPQFVENFQRISQEERWNQFLEQKVKPLYERYQSLLRNDLNETMNLFWSECYEASKLSVSKRNKEVLESRNRFYNNILKPFKTKKEEENTRYNSTLNQMRNQRMLIRKKWNVEKIFLCGPRGPWKSSIRETHWILSHHENYSRMRMKLVPNENFTPHSDASHLRDNTGWIRSKSAQKDPMTMSISQAALRKETDVKSTEEELEDLQLTTFTPEQDQLEAKMRDARGKERTLFSCDCELVTLMSVIKGKMEITQTSFYFYDKSSIREDTDRHDFQWSLTKLREVHLRRYNLRSTALEFFLTDQSNYFINFNKQTRKNTLATIFKLRPPNLSYHSYRSPSDLLRSSGLTQKWVNREITNFDYLMQLNTIAGRTYNDLSQYPVFPWILADYSSEELDLNNPKSFRDLSKPVGVVNPANEAEVRNKYNAFEDPYGVIAKFHYGTHYSNSGGVLHYMVRVEPFTSLHIDLQSGRFDVADRQFHSIPQTWKLLMENPNDVKELIPEFFYFPEFLKNINNFDLGVLQSTQERVHDVILPKWASSPEDFIDKHRKALECEYVSSHLHEWIDLVFGYKQRGQHAVDALNVFYYCSYEGAVDLDAITDPIEREAVEGMINNFGQTPSQLLKEPHPVRLSLDEALYRMLKMDLKKPDFTLFFDLLNHFYVEIANDRDPVVFISSPQSSPKGFLQITASDKLVTVSRNGLVGIHSWLPYDKNSTRGFSLEMDQSLSNLKNRRDISRTFHPSIKLHSKLFAVSQDTKFLFSAGHWDCSIKVYNLIKNKSVCSAIRHTDIVTCLSVDTCGWYLISGSKDCTSIIWDVTQIQSQPPSPCQLLNGHDEPISSVAIATELDMAISGSLDGTVNVYTISEGRLLRTLTPTGCSLPVSEVTFVTISVQGHIAFAATDKVNHSVHVFSINGEHLGAKYILGQVTGITTASDCLVVVDDAGDLTVSRLLGLEILYSVPLHIPIQSVVTTNGNTHLLVPLRDGHLVITGLPNA